MQKRGFADHFGFGHFDTDPFGSDTSAGIWNLTVAPAIGAGVTHPGVGLDIASVVSEGHAAWPGIVHGSGSDTAPEAPEAAAAGGKKGAGGGSGTATGGSTTSTTGSGTGSTTGGGTTSTTGSGTGSTTGQGTTTTVFHDLPTHWQTLAPTVGDTTLPTDTYFYKQWNLTSNLGGINVTTAWQNYTGAGIKIGVVDDGIDYNHPDLNPNYLLNLDYNAVTADGSAYGSSTDSHGTTVAGVLAAARDGSGIVGVAYNAEIAGFRISYATGGASQLADALNHLATNGMDVANASWGYSTPYQDNFYGAFAASKSAIQNDVANGRGGLGINIVFAAGNNRASGDDVNYHNYQNDPYVITVAATNDYGWVASFSTPGAAVLISAPGSWVMTDDRLGASGWSATDYFATAGTSYAAPTIAGVVALMLQANSSLGYRDVQEILAYSAKNSDPGNTSWQTNGARDWNGGGLHFNPNYGFGLVDATAAVRLAESWQKQSTFANLSSESATHTDNAKIPDGTGSLQSTINFTSSLLLDKVVVGLNITHAHVSDLTVTLTSPNGTTATLASHPASGTGTGIVFETSANNFWGEDAKGNWTLTVTDNVTGNVGTLNSWTLQALGDGPNTPTTYIYTDEFATAAGADRAVLHDTSGTATLNTAAVTTGSYLDLHAGALDTIAGRTLQIASDSVIKFAWAGDGNDTIIANDLGNTIQGGRGNDTIVAGAGADKLYGGLGADTFVFNSMTTTTDVIGDFTSGQDVIDLHVLLTSIGYNGTDPLADKWINLASNGSGGTYVQIDAHNGQGAVTILDLAGVQLTALHQGANYGLLVA
ncbi:MAG: S8 family serine peptidase [Bradyrhizobium sp.]